MFSFRTLIKTAPRAAAMNKVDFREARRYQLSLILIGACLGGKDIREFVMSRLRTSAISSPKAYNCMKAIEDKDSDGVDGFLRSIGVEAKGGKAISAVIDRLHQLSDMDHVENTLTTLLAGDLVNDVESAEERLEAALALVRNSKATVFSKG